MSDRYTFNVEWRHEKHQLDLSVDGKPLCTIPYEVEEQAIEFGKKWAEGCERTAAKGRHPAGKRLSEPGIPTL